MEGAFSNGMCRCCASEGTFKDVLSKYHWMGEEEIYADMLSDCFDISLTNTTDGGLESGICEVCITQLRNAVNFKKQVLHTEMQFKKKLQEHMFKVNIVKVEVSPLDDAGNDSDNNLSDDYSGPEYDVPIKTEVEVESKPKKRGKATPASKAKKPKVEDAETSTKSNVCKTANVGVSKILNRFVPKPSKVKSKRTGNITVPANKKTKKTKQINSQLSFKRTLKLMPAEASGVKIITGVMDKHLHNVRLILLSTNATPIRKYDGVGYCCGFCNDHYTTPAELKVHTIEEHKKNDINRFMRSETIPTFVVKIDITDLRCNICQESIGCLESLVKHLVNVHEKTWYNDVDNRILTFKFENGEMSCAVCSKTFISYKLLQEHMTVHYSNYLCEVCNAPFVVQRALQLHVKRHDQGEFPCRYCSKIFGTSIKRDDHEKYVHKKNTYKRSKCHHCEERFSSYKLKNEHMVSEHGMPPIVLKCMACDLSFSSRDRLTRHTKKDHLMERPHECQQCDKKFFTTLSLKNHMLKHTGVKRYKCEVCMKSYGRRNTLIEHLRIHADDRRFKCEHCGQAFVQKCSLKSHLQSKHGEMLCD